MNFRNAQFNRHENCKSLLWWHWNLDTNWYVNSLWPGDATWWQRTQSTLAQVMACCLITPGHFLNQCWLINNEIVWHLSMCNFTGNPDINPWIEFENHWFNTLRPRLNGAIFQTTFSNRFSWIKMFEYQLIFHWNLFPRVQLIISQRCFR